MARVNNLSNFLTDVATAIKTKKGSQTAIPAANFDTEILALPSQGVYEQRVLNISANGSQTITPGAGFDAIDELTLTVAVPEKQLQSKTYEFTDNAHIVLSPEQGYDGFSSIDLTINVPSTGGDTKPNIFLQDVEPTKKDGIWLQTTGKEYEKITAVDNLISEPSWLPDGSVTDIPYKFINGSTVAVGTDVYLLGGLNTTQYNNYKYDTLTDTYTKMTDIPSYFTPGMQCQFAIAIGTDIYIFCDSSKAYKYDTLTDTYTQITSIPLSDVGAAAGVVGTNIYVFSGYRTMYKYDTLTNTYTSITFTNIYAFFTGGSVITIGTDLYVFQSSSLYKYDTLTDTITTLSGPPNLTAEAIGTDIYLFGNAKDENNNRYTTTYKYDTTTDTYTQLTNIYNYDYVCGTTNISAVIGAKIYLFGGSTDNDSKVAVLQTSMSFDDKSIVLLNGNTYKTQLFTNDIVDSSVKYPFNDVFYYTAQDGLDGTMPVYYGDGAQWINIKNPPGPTEIQTYYEIEYD